MRGYYDKSYIYQYKLIKKAIFLMQLKAGFIKNFEGMSGKLKKSTIRHFDTQLMQFIDVKRPIVFL